MRVPGIHKIFFLFILSMLLAGPATAELLVAVTVEPQAYAVERVGGKLVSSVVLVPAGADPHTYEPKPSQVAKLANADMYLTIGLEFEKAWLGRLAAANPNLRVRPMNAGLEHGDKQAVHEPAEQHDAVATHHHDASSHMTGQHAVERHDGAEPATGHHHHNGLDPHVWTAPMNMEHMARNVLEYFLELDPANAKTYRGNYAAFAAEIAVLDAELNRMFLVIPESQRVFLVFHPAWGHFAKAYGLTQFSIEVDGKEPGPVEMARIISRAKEHGVRAVFVQPQISRRTAGVVASSLGASLVDADPLARDWAANLRIVAGALADAMR